MRLTFRFLAAAALACAATTAAHAQPAGPQIYGAAGYAEKTDADLGAVQLRLGARFGSYFGVEGEYGLGVKSNTLNFDAAVPAFYIKRKLRHELAAYAVGYLPITPQADVFARVGLGNTWFKVENNIGGTPLSYKVDESSFNLGVGAQYFFDANNGLRVDYVRQDYKDLPSDDVWSLAYTRRF